MKKIVITMMAFGLAGLAQAQCQNFGKAYGGYNRNSQMHKMGGYQQMPQKHYGGYNHYQQKPQQYGGGFNRYIQQPQAPQYQAQPVYGFGQRGRAVMNRYNPFTQTQPAYRRPFIRR